jgi:outer membrane protein OmpA-like peptidoglycan-associated protein
MKEWFEMHLPTRALRAWIGAVACVAVAGVTVVGVAGAETEPKVSGKIEWGLWVDADGCQHWWADGGEEGYMVARVNPSTGKPICAAKSTCLVADADTVFATGSADLSTEGRESLTEFFKQQGESDTRASFAISGHTDSRGSAAANQALSERRATTVADLARSLGARVERQTGYGESQPVASNATAAGMQKNRRVEVVCYKW